MAPPNRERTAIGGFQTMDEFAEAGRRSRGRTSRLIVRWPGYTPTGQHSGRHHDDRRGRASGPIGATGARMTGAAWSDDRRGAAARRRFSGRRRRDGRARRSRKKPRCRCFAAIGAVGGCSVGVGREFHREPVPRPTPNPRSRSSRRRSRKPKEEKRQAAGHERYPPGRTSVFRADHRGPL